MLYKAKCILFNAKHLGISFYICIVICKEWAEGEDENDGNY